MNAEPPLELNVEYDYVAIVDFLPEADRKRERLGEKLCVLLSRDKIGWQRVDCHSKQSFISALLWLAAESRAGKVFALHLVGHGETTGLVMPDGSLLNWSVIAPAFRKFAPTVLGKCILNLSCCSGINAVKITDHLPEAARFFGLLGPARPIYFSDALKINSKFYRKMIAGEKINDIIRATNKEFGKQILYGITTHGYQTLKGAKPS